MSAEPSPKAHYVKPPELYDGLRLHQNENTLGCSPRVIEALARLRPDTIGFYPPYTAATGACARYFGVSPDHVVLVNGLDEGIMAIAVAHLRLAGSPLIPEAIIPEPAFEIFRFDTAVAGGRVVPVMPARDFRFAEDDVLAAITPQTRVVFLTNPNNPTGVLYPQEDVVEIIKACKGLVVLDEAYHVFAGKSLMSRLPEFSNLVIIRTVSKLGLAGIRLGYLVGRPEWVQQFDKVRPPYNVNVLTQAAALFLLERLDVLEDQAARIKADRTGLGKSLAALKGVTVFPSEANFFLIRVPDAEQTFRALKEQNVLIKNLHPGLRNCLRVTVGTPDENRILLTALREAI